VAVARIGVRDVRDGSLSLAAGSRYPRGVAAPHSFGRYRVTGTLGAVAMGEVYAASDDVLGREVAVKTLCGHLSQLAAHILDERTYDPLLVLAQGRAPLPDVSRWSCDGRSTADDRSRSSFIDGAPGSRRCEDRGGTRHASSLGPKDAVWPAGLASC
jgi:hypothetical protein